MSDIEFTAAGMRIGQEPFETLVEAGIVLPDSDGKDWSGIVAKGGIQKISNMPSVIMETMNFRNFVNEQIDGAERATFIINTEKDCFRMTFESFDEPTTNALRAMIRAFDNR